MPSWFWQYERAAGSTQTEYRHDADRVPHRLQGRDDESRVVRRWGRAGRFAAGARIPKTLCGRGLRWSALAGPGDDAGPANVIGWREDPGRIVDTLGRAGLPGGGGTRDNRGLVAALE